MEFDHRLLDSLPLPDTEEIKRVIQVLKAIAVRRVLPYFKKKRGTDPSLIARIREGLIIQRLEDEANQIRIVSLVSGKDNRYIIHIHERVFDYLAFVIPSDPESRLSYCTIMHQNVRSSIPICCSPWIGVPMIPPFTVCYEIVWLMK
jgi:ATP-dependent Lon protease